MPTSKNILFPYKKSILFFMFFVSFCFSNYSEFQFLLDQMARSRQTSRKSIGGRQVRIAPPQPTPPTQLVEEVEKIQEPQQLKYHRHHQLLPLQMLQHLPPLLETRMTPGMIAMEKMRMMMRRKKKMTATSTAKTTASTTMAMLLATRVMVLARWRQLATFTPRCTSLATSLFCSRMFYGNWATP
jgi:hypothetical protein